MLGWGVSGGSPRTEGSEGVVQAARASAERLSRIKRIAAIRDSFDMASQRRSLSWAGT